MAVVNSDQPLPPDRDFQQLLGAMLAGDQQAAGRVFNRFAPQLVALAYRRLDPSIRPKVDPEDVVQSACGSFYRWIRDAPQTLDNWPSLLHMLIVFTARKCNRNVERYRAQRRNVAHEVELQPAIDATDARRALSETPLETMLLQEAFDRLIAGRIERDVRIIFFSLECATNAEIADRVHCSQRTVMRVLKELRERLECMQAEETAESTH